MPLTDEELTMYGRFAERRDTEHLIVAVPRLVADLQELREAAGPFQRLLEAFGAQQWGWQSSPDSTCLVQSVKPAAAVTMGDLRRPAACLPRREE